MKYCVEILYSPYNKESYSNLTMQFKLDKSTIIKVVVIAAAAYAIYYLINSYSQKSRAVERFESFCPADQEWDEATKTCVPKKAQQAVPSQPQEEMESSEHFAGDAYTVQPAQAFGSNEVYHSLESSEDAGQFALQASATFSKDCFPKDQLTPAELLPGDANSKWSQSVPAGQGELGDQNFLQSGWHIGVNTVGQTLRNANRQLRSEPVIAQVKVSPFLQSTIEPDINRLNFEIGQTC